MAQKPTSQQAEAPPLRRNRSEPVAREAGKASAIAFAKAGFRDPTLVLRWREIAGSEVARVAQPFRMAEGPSGGVLTLKAEPGASLFLQHESPAPGASSPPEGPGAGECRSGRRSSLAL